jgi:hypothetical protein
MENYSQSAGDTEYQFAINDQDRSRISQSFCFGRDINARIIQFGIKANSV